MHDILLVEDEAIVRMGVKTCIDWKKHGISNVYEAANGLEALDILKKHAVAIMIIDIKMAGMDGIELMKAVEELPNRPEIIIMSCHNDFETMRQTMQLGARDFLFKPKMYPEDIELVIEKALKQISQAKANALALNINPDVALEKGPPGKDKILKAINFIEENLTCPNLNMEMVADYVNLSLSYFSRLFKSIVGTSYTGYVTDKRIKLAEHLYQNPNLKGYEIAKMVGYTNTRYFSKLYKQHKNKTDTTPPTF